MSGKPNEMEKRDCNKWWLSHTISDIPDLLPIESDIYGGRCAGFYTTLYFFPGDY